MSVAQSLFKADATVDKKEVIQALRSKSKREAEKIVREFSPKVSEWKRELKFSLNQIQEEKWQAVKAKLAHCNLKEEEILERLCDLFLAPKPAPKARSTNMPTTDTAPISAPPRSLASLATQNAKALEPKAIPAQTRRWVKEQNQCANCRSNYALEIDHRIPRPLGGSNHPTNLRLLCKQCNQRAAIRAYGVKKMERYI